MCVPRLIGGRLNRCARRSRPGLGFPLHDKTQPDSKHQSSQSLRSPTSARSQVTALHNVTAEEIFASSHPLVDLDHRHDARRARRHELDKLDEHVTGVLVDREDDVPVAADGLDELLEVDVQRAGLGGGRRERARVRGIAGLLVLERVSDRGCGGRREGGTDRGESLGDCVGAWAGAAVAPVAAVAAAARPPPPPAPPPPPPPP